jgi:hypothetical protein
MRRRITGTKKCHKSLAVVEIWSTAITALRSANFFTAKTAVVDGMSEFLIVWNL